MAPTANRITHCIATLNQKGGSGKTTTAVGLAAALARLGYLVTLVDVDPQCNATTGLGVDLDSLEREGKYTVADAFLAKRPASQIEIDFPDKDGNDRFGGRLTLVCGHRGLASVKDRLDAELKAQIAQGKYSELDSDPIRDEDRRRLKRSLDSLRGIKDFVIIDTRPDLDYLQAAAMIAADKFILPIFPSGYDLNGLEKLLHTVSLVKRRLNPSIQLLGVLVGSYDNRTRLDDDIKNLLGEKFKEGVFRTVITRGVRHREATVYRRTIFEHAPEEPAAQQFMSLTCEVLERLGMAAGTEGEAVKVMQEATDV